VNTPSATVTTLYEILSGRAHEPRDWARFRALFTPKAILTPIRRLDGSLAPKTMTVEEYVQSRTAILATTDFFESQSTHRVDVFGAMAHVLSAYESKRSVNAPPFSRGVNSFQLLCGEDATWRIVSILWDIETANNPVPFDLG
jgi:hypothetical protein